MSGVVQGRAQGAQLERGDGLVAERVGVDGVVRAGNQEIDGAGDAKRAAEAADVDLLMNPVSIILVE